MIDGVLGVDGILSIVDPLQSTAPRVAPAARRAAADVIPLRAMLLPEVVAQLQTIFDAQPSPRVFGHHQRRAIALRDDGCITAECGVSAAWCEIHHVVEHSRGGPTHTANGVLLCWHHHRALDRSGWGIRMRHGVPEVRAPGWFDASLRWRAVSTAPIRQRTRILRG